LTFGADADARVQEANATTNYGSSYLRTDGATDPDVESYMRFTVSGASAIASAKLRVYATSASLNGPALYTATNTTWSESAITWGNRPPRTTTPAGDKGSVGANSWVEFDVTPLVSGNGSYTFVLATDSTDGLNMNSREATTTTLRPQLVVQSTAATAVPTADFTASPTSGAAPLTVTFTDRSTGATSWAWDFHDDDSFETTDRNPTFTYTQPGTYTVRLQVENEVGGDEEIKTGYIVVREPSPGGTPLTFNPVADSYVKSDAPTQNNGTSTRVRIDASPVVNTYTRFQLTGLAGRPSAAKLRLCVLDPGPAGGSAYAVSNDWVEAGTGGITWNNAPPITGDPLSTAGQAILDMWAEWDVTAAITGNGTYSFAIKGNSSDTVYYSSREGTRKPELVITP
jgi:trimeric autotransporter adhesin